MAPVEIDAMSTEPIATTSSVPIAATWTEVRAPNCAEVKATNWSVVNASICADVSPRASAVVRATKVEVTRLEIAPVVIDAMSADPIATTSAVPIAAT